MWGSLFYMMATVSMIYQVEMAGLNALELVLVGTALELSAFIFEIPTGVVADTYSRRISVVIGFFIIGVGFIIMGGFPVFEIIVLGSFIWGLGWTFISGAHEAWLADEVGESEAARLYLRGQKLSSYGSFVGITLAVLIGSIQINYPYILAGILFCLWSGFAWLAMEEIHFKPVAAEERSSFSKMGITFRGGVKTIRGSTTLILLMVVGLVFGTFSEGYDRLSTAHLLRSFEFPAPWGLEPVVLFGVFAAVGNLLSIWLVNITERHVDTDDAKQIANTLSLLTALILAGVFFFALSGYIWLAIAMYIILIPLRRVIDPLTIAWLNQHIESEVRATVISMHSQSDALGQVAGGPVIGLVGREFGLRIAIAATALLLVPAVWLYQRSHRDKT
ncbi:MAG: MFS transporter [Proteobacteria bacterium]|nr:MFS transporter [Pseudomonadota bacterium]